MIGDTHIITIYIEPADGRPGFIINVESTHYRVVQPDDDEGTRTIAEPRRTIVMV